MNSCFIATPLGFEQEAYRELQEIWPELLEKDGRPHSALLPEVEMTKGGFEIPLEPMKAVQLNFFLKTANRVLIRLDRFRVRDFPKLHEKLRKIDLKSWVGTQSIRFEVSAAKSRLNHEGRIRETAEKAWNLPLHEEGVGIFIRIFDDECTISLDSSGEHLHRRGIQTLRGEAPLRETSAAFCLRRLIGEDSPGELRQVTLIDPMCGSGTFLSEALSLWTPQFQRPFSFQKFGRLPKLFQQQKFSENYKIPFLQPFPQVRGYDLAPEMIQISKENLSEYPPGSFSLEVRDVLSDASVDRPLRPWIIANPPYGERIAGPPLAEIYRALRRSWRPEKIGLLILSKQLPGLMKALSEETTEVFSVKNGGLDCSFVVISIPSDSINCGG